MDLLVWKVGIKVETFDLTLFVLGCGKTLIAKATAKEAGMRFINLDVAMLTDKVMVLNFPLFPIKSNFVFLIKVVRWKSKTSVRRFLFGIKDTTLYHLHWRDWFFPKIAKHKWSWSDGYDENSIHDVMVVLFVIWLYLIQ